VRIYGKPRVPRLGLMKPRAFSAWLFNRGGMKRSLLFPFLAILVLGLGTEWLIDRTVGRASVIATADRLLVESAARTRERMLAYLDGAVELALADSGLADAGSRDSAAMELVRLVLWRQLRNRSDIDIVSMGFSNGEYVEAQRLSDGSVRSGRAGTATGGDLVLERTDSGGRPIAVDERRKAYDPRLRPWYISAAGSGGATWSRPYAIISTGELVMSAGVPVYSEGKLQAVVTADIGLGRLPSLLQEASPVPGSLALLVDEGGAVIASSEPAKVEGGLAAAVLARVSGAPGSPLALSREGRTWRALALGLDGKAKLAWHLVLAFPEEAFFSARSRNDSLSLTVLLACLVLTLLFGFLAALKVSQPLRNLGLALLSLDLAKGGALAEVSDLSRRDDEIGRLATSFGELTQRLSESFISLAASVREKELLLKELNHRVKNNLQIVSSLINTQASATLDSATLSGLQRLQERILAMAYVHEEVYQSDKLDLVEMDRYLERIADSLLVGFADGGYGLAFEGPKLSIKILPGGLRLPLDLALPCGLIANELIANCLKHAFAGRESGLIQVSLAAAGGDGGGRLRLVVEDDGVGMGSEAAKSRTGPGGIGSILVEALVAQLHGGMEKGQAGAGARVEIVFPCPEEACAG